MFTTDFFVAGIAPYGNDIALLAYISEGSTDGKRVAHERPELQIVTYTNEEISTDSLSVNGFESYFASHYRLEYLASEMVFYIVSPKDIVVARPRDLEDHISWLIERQKYAEALEAAESAVKSAESTSSTTEIENKMKVRLEIGQQVSLKLVNS